MNDQSIEQKNLLVNKNDNIRILRGKHDKENPYAQISRKMIRDKSLSPKAKGVLCFLLSLPENWDTHPRQLADSLGVSKDQIYTVLKELIKTRYAIKIESKGEKGRFKSVTYHFFEEKQEVTSEIKIKSTVSGFPDTVFPDTETPALRINIEEEISIQNTNNTPPNPQKGEPPDGGKTAKAVRVCESFGSHVKLTKEEHKALNEKYGESVITEIIEEMNDWCLANGKSYKDYAAAIRQWMRNPSRKKDQKERKFAPSSDDKRAIANMNRMLETAL